MHPTLPTLLRIALVFSVGLDHFLHPGTQAGAGDRPETRPFALPGFTGLRQARLLFRKPGFPRFPARPEFLLGSNSNPLTTR